GNNDRKDIYIDPNEYEDIYEAGFRYLYEDSGFKDRDFKMIFLEIRSESEIPDEFYQRFNGVPIPVRSPFKKYDDYEGDFRDGRYWADDENDIVVDINGIYEFDKTHVFLDCSDSTSFSPGWRFIYLLEKKDGKWVVVQADQISEL
ncbi:MAG: hypothetical protein GY869_15080, partial [Planctomycetes bacterium]|nr:hypothetical protein [Planctomycetota bacterium]